MRIVLIGQAAFGEKVLQAMVQRKEEVVGVYIPPDVPGKPNSFKDLAKQLGVPCFQPARMRAPEVYEEYVKLKADLNVMAFVTDIVPESILNYPKFGTIQYHPSLLPRHRGASSMNWAIINGETKTGLTIFWPDKGLDTGLVLLQKEVEISPDDTTGSLYFNKLFQSGIDALMESIDLVKTGKAPRIKQDESLATYEGICKEKDAVINWSHPVSCIYNLIRGANPQPGATTVFQGKRLKIFDSEMLPGNRCNTPGKVVEINKQGFTVAAICGSILIKKIQIIGSPKISAVEFAVQTNLKVGDKLGE